MLPVSVVCTGLTLPRRGSTAVVAWSHLQAHRIDEDEQHARSVDDDAEKRPDRVKRVLSRVVEESVEIYQPEASATPVGQGDAIHRGIRFELRSI